MRYQVGDEVQVRTSKPGIVTQVQLHGDPPRFSYRVKLKGQVQGNWKTTADIDGEPWLSDDELEALDLTAKLADLVVTKIIGRGDTRDGDIGEFVHAIHSVQRMIMSQAAARAYPDTFRLLGEIR